MATAVAAGTSVASLTAAGTLQFADRYGYMQVTNTGTAVIYVTGDPNNLSPAANNDGIPVAVGDSVLVANQNPLWYQSSRVIQKGANQFGGGNTATANGSVGLVTPMESLAGQMANPGTTISASGACTVAAAG
jgi:hypothetical protein